ncbi:MAG: hypothetical protein ABI972_14610, partial [Acidobacteriota bacterium]
MDKQPTGPHLLKFCGGFSDDHAFLIMHSGAKFLYLILYNNLESAAAAPDAASARCKAFVVAHD